MNKFGKLLLELPRVVKTTLLVLADLTVILVCLNLAMYLRLETYSFIFNWQYMALGVILAISSVLLFFYFDVYKIVIRFSSINAYSPILKSITLLSVILVIVSFFVQAGIPRSVPFIFWLLALVVLYFLRWLVFKLLVGKPKHRKSSVSIAGTNVDTSNLIKFVNQSDKYQLDYIFDWTEEYSGRKIEHVEIVTQNSANYSAILDKTDLVILALSETELRNYRRFITQLSEFSIETRVMPKVDDLIEEDFSLKSLEPINVIDLLKREPITPREGLMKKNIDGQTVLVTGAGGTIGTQLCIEVLKQTPKKLLALDVSEFAVYNLLSFLEHNEIEVRSGIKIIPIIGSILDEELLERIFEEHEIDTIYHAAAYKHVPLMEENTRICFSNNVKGTLNLAKKAVKTNVDNFILISSDKAVRPTNHMGVSKRCSELICQSFDQHYKNTNFCMVRFGNVLSSSGSVIPKFERQISEGGPLTVTDKNITRYFMTIQEAAELVIQAGSMANGGEVFVLDMGEPIKILDLACLLINLRGLKPKIVDGPSNEGATNEKQIEVEFAGLRPGEKLYEELFFNAVPHSTDHERIKYELEDAVPLDELLNSISDAEKALISGDFAAFECVLSTLPIMQNLDTKYDI